MITRINIFLMIMAVLAGQAIAKEYDEKSLRTLFTSQQERQEIDSNKRASDKTEEQVIVGPASVQINGVVKRSKGKSVVWINGKSTMENSTVDGVKVYSNAINSKNKVPVMVDGERIYLKPGETWSEEAGVVGVGD
ncbi:MAG: hypothetical protein OQK32_03270 [Gammaproteobacteria bacterium]|nr:hypothetical protein [Gammaproteobacteria bacterium]MCW8922033.1 hypothetical protein [Gammaproteobacteria bacterium]